MTRPLRTGLSLAIVAALTLALGIVAGQTRAFAYAVDGPTIPVDTPNLTAVLDSPIGHGADLMAGEPTDISAGPVQASAHSALVRLTGFNAAIDTTISATGAPALAIAAGRSASTTLLVPIVDGHFQIVSSADLAARVEVLATFAGVPDAAGSTVALKEAINRPGEGIQVTARPAAPAIIGVTGLGGVPSQDVRAVHLSLTATAASDTTLTVDGQRLPVAAGTTTLSTIVTPSSDGEVTVEARDDVRLRLDVRGYVAEAAQWAEGLNGPGAYWPEIVGAPTHHTVVDSPDPVDVGGRADASRVLALVWAEPAQHLTTLTLGDEPTGRTSGALVDPTAGAQPQLALVPADNPLLALRRGSTTASVLTVGTLVGTDAVESGTAAGITVDSPAEGTLTLAAEITFTFTGTITPGETTPLRIEVERGGEPYGLASIVPTSDGVGWTYQAALQESAHHTYTFTLVGRDGDTVSTQWAADITIPGEGDLILQEGVVPLGWPGTDQEILETADSYVDFATKPGFSVGDVIAGGVTDGSPVGLLRRVVAIDDLGDRWRVHTGLATFTDVFLQVSRNAVVPLAHSEQPEPQIEIVDAEDHTEGLEDEELTAEFVDADLVDLSPLEHEAELSSEMDDANIDEPPTDWKFEAANARFAPMAMPVPPPPAPEDPTGPAQPPPSTTPPSEGESDRVGLLGWTFKDKGSGHGVDYELFLDVRVYAEFGFTMKLEIGHRWTQWWGPIPPLPYPVVEHFETLLTTDAQANVEGSLDFKGSWKRPLKADVINLTFNPITLFIGPVPVVITFSFKTQFQANLDITAQFHMSFKAATQVQHRLGYRYTHNGGARSVNENKTTYRDPVMSERPIIEGKIVTQAGPEFSVRILIYDSAGPTIGFGLKVGLDFTAQLTWEGGVTAAVEFYLQGNIFLRFTAKIPVVDITLNDTTLLNLTFRWPIRKWTSTFETPVPDPDPDPDPEPDPDPDPDPTEQPTPPGTTDALEFARGIEVIHEFWSETEDWVAPVDILAAEWVEGPPSADAVGIVDANFVFPGGGSYPEPPYPVMSTGHRNAFHETHDGDFGKRSSRGPNVFDATTLRIDFDRPVGATCVQVDYLFGADNVWEDDRSDIFVIEWGQSTWSVDAAGNISAPDSIIDLYNHDGISWNNVVPARYESFYGDYLPTRTYNFERTGAFWTVAPLPAEGSSMYLSIADLDTSDGESAVALQRIIFLTTDACDALTQPWWATYGGN